MSLPSESFKKMGKHAGNEELSSAYAQQSDIRTREIEQEHAARQVTPPQRDGDPASLRFAIYSSQIGQAYKILGSLAVQPLPRDYKAQRRGNLRIFEIMYPTEEAAEAARIALSSVMNIKVQGRTATAIFQI